MNTTDGKATVSTFLIQRGPLLKERIQEQILSSKRDPFSKVTCCIGEQTERQK